MKIRCIPVGAIQTNCYVVINEEAKEALVIDPGEQAKDIRAFMQKQGVTPVAILLTHGHFDHTGAVEELKGSYGIPVYAAKKEKSVLSEPNLSMADYTLTADEWLEDEEKLSLAGFNLTVIATPGHTPGGCCFYFEEEKVLFSGDTLFCESVGRTDFPGGSMSALIRAIREKLFCLPDDVLVFPGHMGETNIGHEKQYNPFVV